MLDAPESLLPLLSYRWAHCNGHNVQVKPQARAQRWTHTLQESRQTSPDEFHKVSLFILSDLWDDVLGNGIVSRRDFIERDLLDGVVEEVGCVVSGDGDGDCVFVDHDG